jgi:hypothetical protein
MPITVPCPCGKNLTAPDGLAGKRAKCPSCGDAVEVPLPAPPAGPAREPGSFARGCLVAVAAFSALIAVAGVVNVPTGSGVTVLELEYHAGGVRTAAVCLTVALAGLAASNPRRPS